MIIKFVVIFISGLVNIILGFFIFKKNSKNPINFWYFILCLTGGGWGIVKAVQLSWMNIFWVEHLIIKLTFIFGILAPLSYLLLAYNFPYKLKAYGKKIIFLVYFFPWLLVFLVMTGALKKENDFIFNNVLYREINLFDFSIFAIYYFVYVFLGFFILLKKYLSANNIYRPQIKYLMIATVGTFLTTGFVSVILLLFNNFAYDWLGAIFLLIHFGVAAYLIFYKPSKNIW